MNAQIREPLNTVQAKPCFSQQRLVALELFAVHGFRQVSMRDLAKSLGLSHGAIYNHVESKEQLLFGFFEELYSNLNIHPSLDDRRLSPPLRLRKAVEWHVSLHESMALHFRLVEKESANLTAEFAPRFEALQNEYLRWICSLIQPCMKAHDKTTIRSRARSVVTLLNQVPRCLQQANVPLLDPVEILLPIIMRALC
ncbi:TetR/AcrR family transcriptional regulator [Pseudomonas sp. TR47]|uniref:TetR/AcrR family transcriptional regulator n=1 Tax=Pseudomonas sp. TR47 TaxID=3342639 RepID=UPI0037706E32